VVHVCRRVEFDLKILDKFCRETTPDDFPDFNIPDTPELNHFNDVDYASWDDKWVKRWRAFTGDGLTGDADDEIPSPSLGVDVELPMPEAGDNYVNASLMLPRGNSLARGTVIGQKRDARGDPIGNTNTDPIMDSRIYHIEFDDGNVCELTVNIIAESMYASCNADGNEYILFDSFIDYKSNLKAVRKDNQQIVHNGRNSLRRSTVGWHLCVQWKDGKHIIALVKERSTRFLKKTHKFGIEVPRSVAEAYALDKKNSNTLWADSIAKEMKNVRIAFKILANGVKVPIGFQRMRCHMIFYIKMEDMC